MGMMVSAAVMNVRSGQGAARVRGAARDILAQIRRARSLALVTRAPSHITYSTKKIDEEICAVVEVRTDGFELKERPRQAWTLAGTPVAIGGGGFGGAEAVAGESEEGAGESAAAGDSGSTPMAQLLQNGIDPEICKGLCLKVVMGDERLVAERSEEQKRSSISASAFVDGQKTLEIQQEEERAGETAFSEAEATTRAEIRWESNGRTEPHRVYVYQSGTSPEKGLVIKIDRFGGIKVLGGDEEDGE